MLQSVSALGQRMMLDTTQENFPDCTALTGEPLLTLQLMRENKTRGSKPRNLTSTLLPTISAIKENTIGVLGHYTMLEVVTVY